MGDCAQNPCASHESHRPENGWSAVGNSLPVRHTETSARFSGQFSRKLRYSCVEKNVGAMRRSDCALTGKEQDGQTTVIHQ